MKTILLLTILKVLVVLDSITNEPLTGVEVTDLETNKTYYTNLDGEVVVPNSSCEYKIRFISYGDTIICDTDTLRLQ